MYVLKGRVPYACNILFTSITWSAEMAEVDNLMNSVTDLNTVSILFVRMGSELKSAVKVFCCE
jgi:hypothetical protein